MSLEKMAATSMPTINGIEPQPSQESLETATGHHHLQKWLCGDLHAM